MSDDQQIKGTAAARLYFETARQNHELFSWIAGSAAPELQDNLQALLEMFFARSVDNFETYLVGLLRAILRKQPALIKTRQQSLTLEAILKHASIDTLVHEIIETKVNALTYEGFGEIRAWCADKGIPLLVSPADEAQLVEMIATRNLIAHHRCRMDERYVRAFGGAVGAVRRLDTNEYLRAARLLDQVVADSDLAAAEKFALDLP